MPGSIGRVRVKNAHHCDPPEGIAVPLQGKLCIQPNMHNCTMAFNHYASSSSAGFLGSTHGFPLKHVRPKKQVGFPGFWVSIESSTLIISKLLCSTATVFICIFFEVIYCRLFAQGLSSTRPVCF